MKLKMHREKSDVLSKIIGVFFIILFAFILAGKCLYLFNVLPFSVSIVGTGAIIFIFLGICKYYYNIIDKLSNILYIIRKQSYLKLLFIIVIVSLLTKIIALFVLNINSIDSHPDINVYVTSASELSENGIVERFANYCYSYSHMFWFAVFLSPITKMFGVSQMYLSLYMIIINIISTIMLYDVVVFRFSKVKAFVAFLLYALLPSQILLPQYITHENALLFFISIAVWLYFKVISSCAKKVNKIIAFAFFSVFILFSTMVNSSGFVVLISFLIIFTIEVMRGFNRRKVLCGFIKISSLVLVVVFGTMLFNIVQISCSNIDEDYVKVNKVVWTLYVGSNYETGASWSKSDADKFSEYDSDYSKSKINDYHMNLLKERYMDLFSKPQNLINLIKTKIISIWGNFDYSLTLANDYILSINTKTFYNTILFKPLIFINYLILLVLSIFCFISLIKQRNDRKSIFCVFAELYLLGSTALLMLTEISNKYTIAMLPFFLLACVILIKNKPEIS